MNKPLRSIITLMAERITALDPENQKPPNRESIRQAESISMEMSQIFSALKDPLILVSKQGWPVLSNPAANQLLGLDPTARPIEKVMEKLKLTATNGVPVTYEDLPIKYALEGHVIAGERFSFIDQNDNARYCSISTYPLTLNGENTGAVVVIRDEAEISRHCPSTDLERESFTLRAIFDSAPEAIVVVDETCQIIMSNPKARWLYQGEPTPRYPDAPPNDIIAHPLGRTVFRGEMIADFEMEIAQPDNTVRHILINTSPIRSTDGKITGGVGIFHDITEKKNEQLELQKIRMELENRVAIRTNELLKTVETLKNEINQRKRIEKKLRHSEEKLRQISKKLLETLEADRKTIAKELHDSIGANLAAIKFSLEEKLAKMVSTPPDHLTSLENIVSYLMSTIKETKRISANLHPTTMEDLGLSATISWFCREFKLFYKDIDIKQDIDIDESSLPESIKIVLYRIIQEATSNAAKHGRPDKIDINLRKKDAAVVLTISDNGLGFEPGAGLISADPLSGHGIVGMKERAEICGGKFALKSKPGVGTRVAVEIPLQVNTC